MVYYIELKIKSFEFELLQFLKHPFTSVLSDKNSLDQNMESSIKDLLLKAEEIPILIEKEFTVECCVRGHHIYQFEWDAKIGKELNVRQETRPAALVRNEYVMVLKFNDVSVGHVAKFLSKIYYFHQKHRGTTIARITGERQYSEDLGQGGMELPAKYIFGSTDEDMNAKLPTLIGKAMQEYQKAIKEEKEEQVKKEKQIEKT